MKKYLISIVTLFCLIVLPITGCKVNSEKIYKVYNVTDSSGKTYYNLIHAGDNYYRDGQYNDYFFHGNYTVISSTISGYDLLKLRAKKEWVFINIQTMKKIFLK